MRNTQPAEVQAQFTRLTKRIDTKTNRLRSSTSRLTICVMGVAAILSVPKPALADDLSFSDPTQFQTMLQDILATGSGNSTLNYTGAAGGAMGLDGLFSGPGNNSALDITLNGGHLTIGANDDGHLVIDKDSSLSLGVPTSTANVTLQIGAPGTTGTLEIINGGEVNIEGKGIDTLRMANGVGSTGWLEIRNGGVLDFRSGDPDANYDQFFIGTDGSNSIPGQPIENPGHAEILLDNGSIILGEMGASMRFGIGGSANVVLRNDSIIDSSLHGSHFWVGERSGGSATVTLEDSKLLINGDGVSERIFLVGRNGATGVFTQEGDSYVHLSGLTRIGIAAGQGAVGTYNLNGGILEVGSDEFEDSFYLGLRYWGNLTYEDMHATFNINGGTAILHGDLAIVTVGENNSGIVNLEDGLLDIAGQMVFGTGGEGIVNLNGGVLAMQGDGVTGTGEINFDGGTLQAKGDLIFAHGANIKSGGAILDSNGNTLTYSGQLTGSGGVVKEGEGTVILSADNSHAGGTIIREGVLEATYENALGNVEGDVTLDGGTLKLTGISNLAHDLIAGENGGTLNLNSGDKTFSGNGTGTGNVTIQDGKLLLDGYLSWTGETIVDNATLAMGGDNRLSSSSLLRIELNGTVKIGDSTQKVDRIAGEGEILINEGTFAIGGESALSSFAGDFNGAAGTIRKTGTGTFDFTGNGDFAGDVRVEGGLWAMNGELRDADFEIGPDGTLGGNGWVGSIAGNGMAGGVVAPGNSIGTLSAEGDVNLHGLIYEVEIEDDGTTDRLHAKGDIHLDGGTLKIIANPGMYDPDTQYMILSTEGKIDGEFEEVIDRFAFLDPDLTYENGSILMQLERNDIAFAAHALSPNQAATASALDRLPLGNAVHDAILQLDENGAPIAFDALSGEVHASVRTVLAEDSRRIRMAANDRVRMGFDTSSGADFSTPSSGVGAWATVHGNWSKVEGNGNASELDRSTAGFLTGLDGLVGGWQVGALAGYSHSNFDVDALASSGKAKSFHVGAYAGNRWDAIGLRGGLAYSWSNIDTSRTVAFPGFSERLTADYDAGTLQAFGELGYKIEGGTAWIEPFVNLAHVRVRTDGFTEKGGTAALAVAGQTSNTTFATVGVHAAAQFDLGGTAVEARGTLGWQHGFGDLLPTSNHQFAPNATFSVTGAPLARNAAIIEVGLDFALTPTAKLGLTYGGAFSADTKEHGGKFGIALNF